MAVVSSPEPSIPTPTIPKRTWSLGATDCDAEGIGSPLRKLAPEIREAPAAPALVCKNSRREKSALSMVLISPLRFGRTCIDLPGRCHYKLLHRPLQVL